MSLRVIQAGVQTTVQAGPRTGMRHLGVPACGAADPLSLALANHLVGNALIAPALEVTLSDAVFRFESPANFALTGAVAVAKLNGSAVAFHETQSAGAGDTLEIASFELGARVYLAVCGGFIVDEVLASTSTYLPAAFGGYQGRALQKNELLKFDIVTTAMMKIQTPDEFRIPIGRSWALRACASGETSLLENADSVFDSSFVVGMRADRMGIELQGSAVEVNTDGRMPSEPVFPGTIQCPNAEQLFLLSVDAQTTGGYPRVAQVIRADRHLLGQIRPKDRVRLLLRDEQSAVEDLKAKLKYWNNWLPNVASVI